MKVECITNKCKDIPKDVYEGLSGLSSESEFEIEIRQQSVVYGITTIKKNLWCLVDIGLIYPRFYPHQLFKIIDGRISKYWYANENRDSYDNNAKVVNFGFKELVEDEFFYGKLLEDDPINIAIFKKYKDLMDVEYSDSGNLLTAEILDKNWVMCPVCSDSFETNSDNGLLICPKCKTKFNNPLVI